MRALHTVTIALMIAGSASDAFAQKQTFTIRNGEVVNHTTTGSGQAPVPGGKLAINPEQQWMLAAVSALMKRDFKQADYLYTQILRSNPSNSEAYLQRAITRRELGQEAAMQADAKNALSLLNQRIQQDPRDEGLYQKRSMALRLLKMYDHAKKDLLTAVQLKGKSTLAYQNDMRAIELEERMASTAY